MKNVYKIISHLNKSATKLGVKNVEEKIIDKFNELNEINLEIIEKSEKMKLLKILQQTGGVKMFDFFILIICLTVTFYIATVVRMKNMGMDLKLAIKRSLFYPFRIFLIHFRIYRKYKDIELIKRLKLLFMPITNPQETIVNYAEIYLRMDVSFKIINEMLANASTYEEKEKILESFEKEGIIERVYRKPVVINDVVNSEERFLIDYEQLIN